MAIDKYGLVVAIVKQQRQQQHHADLKEFLEWLDDILIGFEPDELPVVIQMQQKRIGRLIGRLK